MTEARESGGREAYTHGHHPSVVGQHARRTAEADAEYLLPRLRPGLRLLDAGCGPGSITVGLARAVAPGETVGIDVAPAIIDEARALASDVPNLRFEVADGYALDFAPASFDVVHAHQVLQHLARPVEALREWRRVLRPGGVIGVRDADYGTMSPWPQSERLNRFYEVYHAVAARNGADADAGRRLASWAAEAGFVDLEVGATVKVFTTRADVENWGSSWAERTAHSSLAEQAVAYGLASRAEIEELAAAWRAWADAPDAFFMYVNVHVLGRAP
jgi:ubiquinone/menaquinone biosynthesis C-methylase UbiE